MKSTFSVMLLSICCLVFAACGDDDDCCQNQTNWICVSIQDQFEPQADETPLDHQLDCTYKYSFGPNAEGYESHSNCEAGQVLIEGYAGTYQIDAECDGLIGHVKVPLKPYDPDRPSEKLYTSRLVGSLCYNDVYGDGYPIILSPSNRKVRLGDYLGYSTDTRCQDWFGYEEVYWTKITRVLLLCAEDDEDCDPADGYKYLLQTGEFGIVPDGWPNILDVELAPNMVPPGKEVTVLVTLRKAQPLEPPEQEIILPIVIQGSKL